MRNERERELRRETDFLTSFIMWVQVWISVIYTDLQPNLGTKTVIPLAHLALQLAIGHAGIFLQLCQTKSKYYKVSYKQGSLITTTTQLATITIGKFTLHVPLI